MGHQIQMDPLLVTPRPRQMHEVQQNKPRAVSVQSSFFPSVVPSNSFVEGVSFSILFDPLTTSLNTTC